jgi:predicted nucleic acid-binding protein
MSRTFLDTNILIYADDADSPEKRQVAQEIIRRGFLSGEAVLSTQVLQEYFVVATRKLKVPAETAQKKVELLGRLPLVSVGLESIVEAIKVHRLYAISFWDALVVQSARVAGCPSLLSEDMQDGQTIEGVRITNPFVTVR